MIATLIISTIMCLAVWQARAVVGGAPAIFLAIMGAVGLVVAAGVGWGLYCVLWPEQHPAIRRIAKKGASALETVQRDVTSGQIIIRRGPLFVTKDAALVLAPWTVESGWMGDLVWVHPTLQTIEYAGVAVQEHLLITLRFGDGRKLELAVSHGEYESLSQLLKTQWPRVVVGYSERMESWWREDRTTFADRVASNQGSERVGSKQTSAS